ncbi:MAG: glycoside hydrolase family 9 protein [Thermotogae bacterium]|nr:glycoside hydrolase family 9 protein [Thermotogota bacterium]
MRGKVSFLTFLCVFFPLFVWAVELNLNHLEFLRDTFTVEGKKLIGYWVYAERQGSQYVKVPATGEGVTCVDDVARVAIFYLELLRRERNDFYETRAKEALEFVLAMQDNDGDYYNFVEENGKINRVGPTSRKSGNWWAVRALWATALGSNVYKEINPAFSHLLEESSRKVVDVLERYLIDGLLHGYTDISSAFVLGLCELYEKTREPRYLRLAEKIANAMIQKQISEGPFAGAINEGKEHFAWHGWGSRHVEAFVKLYNITKKEKYLDTAHLYADELYMKLLIVGPIYHVEEYVRLYPQLSYAAECMVSGLAELFKATKEDRYAVMAALAGGFFLGNNVLGQSMIGPNGEGYDGLHSVYINKNAGAESTVCALRALAKLNELSKFSRFAKSRRIAVWGVQLLEAEKMETGISSYELDLSGNVSLSTDSFLRLRTRLRTFKGNLRVFAFLKGSGRAIVKISMGDSKSEKEIELPQRASLVELANSLPVETAKEQRLTLYIKPLNGEVTVDQILIVSDHPFLIFEIGGKTYQFNGKTVQEVKWSDFQTEKVLTGVRASFEEREGYLLLDLTPIFNNDGIIRERKHGNFDNPDGVVGSCYSWEEMEKQINDSIFLYQDIPFKISEKSSGEDNIVCSGQRIELGTSVKVCKIYMLGSSDHGDYEANLILLGDSECVEKRIAFSDWCGSPVFGERTALKMKYRYLADGQKQFISPKLYVWEMETDGFPLSAIELPLLPTMHIFAITLAVQ